MAYVKDFLIDTCNRLTDLEAEGVEIKAGMKVTVPDVRCANPGHPDIHKTVETVITQGVIDAWREEVGMNKA